eukprot:TRINITY_DN2667_c0_g1_i5.p1 TRINITY_DN2667_c0_g1~~TRINITY_DN2667_c0_g1_i5.p1  ORF type:complete len:734 (-),score=94.16 TRINITY_DN2667_c0_g1_i5:302-2503(-)
MLSIFSFPSLASRQGASGTVHCASIRPDRPICMDETYMNDVGGIFDPSFRGACRPCTLNQACARALPNTPICNVPTGSCRACVSNSECSGFGTGFANCQADGSCKSCTSDSDCGTRDGGEKNGQPSCNILTGICAEPFFCTGNPSCTGRSGNNCQINGACVTCTSNSLCGNLDGGEVSFQPVCNVLTGICISCSTNQQCIGTSGANCQNTGICVTCTSDVTCASDGGEVGGQSICNLDTGICEGMCQSNAACATRSGKNCQKSGRCVSCTSDGDCGPLDGGETPDQTRCNVAFGVCVTPFTCTSNPSCANRGGNNCQKDFTCISCVDTSTCGIYDGGEVPLQPNCNTHTGLCVDTCRSNFDCLAAQGANCQADGICKTCRGNSDCGSADGGEKPGQPVCDPSTGICESACTSNLDCQFKTGKNCMKDGICFSCISNSDCGSYDGGEVPNQLECTPTTGICKDPFRCTTNPSCVGHAGANCQLDSSCRTCKSNSDCGALDGGEVARQPICNVSTGICGFCNSNAECPSDAKNCGFDGLCYACSYQAGGKPCGGFDGPPNGLDKHQPNCDEKLGVCVDGCTLDRHCMQDLSKPYCNVEKRCCAECVLDSHCPHVTWRDSRSAYTTCSVLTNMCVKGCSHDNDCTVNGSACAVSLGLCVDCLYNSHCSGNKNKPYCHPSQLVCTDVNGWSDTHLSSGAIAGIIVACIVGSILIVIISLLLINAFVGPASNDGYSGM